MFLGGSSASRVRRTKIVATLGPASDSPEIIEALIRAGLGVARLNFSHGDHESHRRTFSMVRQAAAELRRPVAILQDLQGPKIRLGKLKGEVTLADGQQIRLSSRGDFVGEGDHLPTTYERLAADVQVGQPILLADGRLLLEALEVSQDEVVCRVKVGGTVTSNKGINLPGTALSVPALVDKDRADLEFGLSLGVDYVALSFVRSPHDIIAVRELMAARGASVPIIAKLEKPEAVERLPAILEAADGIMIARGDLGVELPAEEVPPFQRRAIRLARERGKPTIVATQMLVSMTEHARPTHAEVSDVANAVFDGAGAVMLSEETAAGRDPVRALETMAAIAASADRAASDRETPVLVAELRNTHAAAIARAAAGTSREMGAKGIVCFTHRGLLPRLLSDWRPECPVLCLSPSQETVNRMALVWGIESVKIDLPESLERLIEDFERVCAELGFFEVGETVVMTAKFPFIEGQLSNIMKLHTVGTDTYTP